VSEVSVESDGRDAFVVYNGVRIAKRGQPNTPQAGTWVSLVPGFRVSYKGYPAELVIERDGKIIKKVWRAMPRPSYRGRFNLRVHKVG